MTRFDLHLKFVIFFLALLAVTSCKNYDDVPYAYRIPEKSSDSLAVGTISEVSMDSNLVFKAIRTIKGGGAGQVHSLLVYRNDKLVVEEYFGGNKYKWDAPYHYDSYVQWTQEDLHNIMSVNKSITAACIEIAIDKGWITSVEQSIFDYLPEHQHLKREGREDITIEHLLTMTSGLVWSEWNADYSTPDNPIIGIWYADKDPISFILDAPLTHKPGEYFSYFGGHHILLGEILRHATGLSIDDFAAKYLFEPMGIQDVEWTNKFNNGVVECAGNLKMKPRDMLKFGIVFLENGKWNQSTILSEQWITKSSTPYAENKNIKIPGENAGPVGYAYSWWTKELFIDDKLLNVFWANGWGGQKIIVIPDKKAVLVFTGGDYNSGTKQFDLLEDYIVPAMQ
jgi:CubicO group peptidase (beta-lactamase class C family)